MNEIERAVVMPKGANALGAYDRNYAIIGPDKVVGIYLIPPRDGTGQMPDRKRRWLRKVADLPSIFDGGFMQGRIEYRISTNRVLNAVCNEQG